jgi:hypothetical protein
MSMQREYTLPSQVAVWTPGIKLFDGKSLADGCSRGACRAIQWTVDLPTLATAWAAGFSIGGLMVLLLRY